MTLAAAGGRGRAEDGIAVGARLIAAAFLAALAFLPGAAAAQDLCRPKLFEGADYVVCTVDLRRYRVRLFWRGPDGAVLGSFDRMRQTPEGSRAVFAMNAGMYHEDGSPVGLYVENGREFKKANTADGPGNFHLKPNGIFFVSGATAGVLETSRYLRQRITPDYATQSGPMLVLNGRIHPRISENGPSRKIRNGVGVSNRHTVVFAISERPVTFGEFARLFRDELRCPDALFLDGSVSSLYAPALGRADGLLPLGPIVAALPRD
ncbi:MAG TPA: phosphodiester glycosidase family protein [Microvirga sp.]|nr:phosphodiester glycosidase family protein [Microvirga sp.]